MRLFRLSIFLLTVLLANFCSIAGAETGCSFKTMVTTEDYSFNVSSQPAESCEKQLLTISVLKQANPFTQFINPSAYLVEKAWAEDIDEDGNFELLSISRNISDPSKKSLEIYVVDGNSLKQIRLPAAVVLDGYRGGDNFFLEHGRIVRTYPLYLPADADGRSSGGLGRVLYQYRNKEILLVAGRDKAVSIPSVEAKPVPVRKNSQVVNLKSIEVKHDYIEIKADGAIDKYKTVRIADPWRLIIDIYGVDSAIAGREINVDRHGISRIRIGPHKDYIRLVFDSAVSPLPVETVTQAENALRVGFIKH